MFLVGDAVLTGVGGLVGDADLTGVVGLVGDTGLVVDCGSSLVLASFESPALDDKN